MELKTETMPQVRLIVLVAAALLTFLVGPAQGQTGPGGVGNASGSAGQPENVLWLRADEGVQDVGGQVLRWDDQSGNGFQATAPDGSEPTLVSGAVGGQPGISFDRSAPTYVTIPDAEALDATNGLTVLTAVRPRTIGYLLSKRDGPNSIGYELDIANECDGVLFNGRCFFGPIYSAVGLSISNNADRFFTPNESNNIVAEVPQIITGAATAAGNGNIYLDTEQRAEDSGLDGLQTTASALGIGARPDGSEGFQGDIAEVILFQGVLNQAQRLIVESYLSRKYEATVATGDTVGFAYASNYLRNWAAIGQTSLNESVHTEANAGRLRVTASSFVGSDDRFLAFAHDGTGTNLGYETTEPVNDAPSTIVRIEREWRFDLTSSLNNSSKSVTLSVSASDLPSVPSDFEPALIVSDDPTFASGSRIYTLRQNGSRYETTATINDGDVVTLGGVQRRLELRPASESAFENEGTAPDLTIALNHPHPAETGTDVDVTVTASETGAFGAEGPGPQGSGSDDDDASTNDYTLSPTGSVTLPAGTVQQTLVTDLYDDAVSEQSQSFAVTLSSPVNTALGSNETVYTVLDDDNPRKVSFATTARGETEGSGGGSRVINVPIVLPSSDPAATDPPCTSVKVRLNERSTALLGTLSDPLNDLRLVDESHPGGSCPTYQKRLNEASARVYFEGGQTMANVKLQINEDNVADDAAETAVFDLAVPYSSSLAASNTRFTLTLNDDESNQPEASFNSGSVIGGEGRTLVLTVTLSSTVSRDVSVPFAVDGGATDATAGGDFSILTNSPLSFPAGSTTQTIEIDLLDDTATELREQVVLDLATPSGAVLGSPSRTTISISDDDRLGATGPAGVGSRETNLLWLRPGVLRNSNGEPVTTWPDASGNGNDMTATGSAPTFQTSGFGGKASLSFNDTPMEAKFSRNDGLSIFVVGSSPQEGAFAEVYDDLVGSRNRLAIIDDGGFFVTDLEAEYLSVGQQGNLETITTNISDADVTSGVYSTVHDGDSAELSKNGSVSPSTVDEIARSNSFVLGDDSGFGGRDSPQLTGQISEVIVYNAAFNTTQRQIVENALAAKYNQTLSSGDVYTSSAYTREVFGIGRSTATDFHVAAAAGGLRLDAKDGLGDGDFILAGHNLRGNSLVTSDVMGLGPDPARSRRVWYVDVTNTGDPTTVDLTFDLSEMDLTGQVDDPAQYRLIFSSSDAPYSWSRIATAEATADDKIVFRDLNASDNTNDGYYTVLTRDQSIANLDAQSLAIKGTADNEAPGDVNGGRGGDAGWRMIAAPGTGADVEDLYSLRDNQLVEFGLPGDQMFYRWNSSAAAGPTTGRWAVSSKGDALAVGRGYMLYVFDNANPNFEPVDPTLTINANNLVLTDTETSVTVGDESTSGDTPLASDEEWFVLGNPYPTSFELSALNLDQDVDGDGRSDFKGNVQIWDPSVNTWIVFSKLDPTNNTIAPWQSFFVQRNAFDETASPGTFAETLTFGSSGTTTGAPFVGSKSKSSSATDPHVVLNLELTYRSAGKVIARDQAASVIFHERGKLGRDAFDAVALAPYAVPFIDASFMSPMDDEGGASYARLSLPRPTDPLKLPLALDYKGISGTVNLTVQDWAGVPQEWDVSLIDTGKASDPEDDRVVPLSASTNYAFSITSSKQSGTLSSGGPVRPAPKSTFDPQMNPTEGKAKKSTSRFRLRIEPANDALPVEMSGFDVATSGSKAQLSWETATEENNSGFYVEHQRVGDDSSTARREWKPLAFVEGSGTTQKPSTYTYQTGELEYGKHAFRLRQVDFDGSTAYSEVQNTAVSLNEPWVVRAPYPNPASEYATVEIAVQSPQPITIGVYDLLGRRVQQMSQRRLPGQQTKAIRIDTGRFSSGTYFVRVSGEEFSTTRRITVVR